MNQLALINPENVSEEEAKQYPIREAARAIVVDGAGKIALLHVSKENYYKLPGGGIEPGEDKASALKRECQEEIGCDIEIVEEIGSIVEYRKVFHLTQISYCYLAKVVGAKGTAAFTTEERDNGFTQVWVSYEEAIRALETSSVDNFEGSAYIVPRDTIFLQEAKAHLVNLGK
jgi:8-oxo-dGTP diphosphatase